ncbi:MAG: NADH-quinone oxidoreductase subunit L [Acidimicrobiaceae bacterium]|nr:NADH-quinone oxidoreductase subunit L [Acidimicrobiaceae bacterium]MYG56747.1 NADH-quinone oxidoreductase subunit L [Acidimicrobiaceae bacterium]
MDQLLDLAWLIVAFPLVGFALILLFGRRLGEPAAGWLATAAMAGSFVASVAVFVGLQDRPEDDRRFVQTLFEWVPAGDFSVDAGFLVDPLSVTMTLFITGVGALIHLYSIGYMHGDSDFSKFFMYLNLFAFSMLMLVLGDNMLLTFLGWEGVGVCSYFLISFWFTDEYNASAGKKAFVTNRIGDWGFMVAMFLTFTTLGSIQYIDVLDNAGGLEQSTATAITVLLLVGAAGKSAQIPLYVWLPDAMAGPTPVSALIHAATMVTSGVYLLTRVNPIIAESAVWAPSLIAWVGAITALLAATIAVAQNDIKKVLAYSTISQLGYMFLAVGSGAYVAAIFHMVTHAFFKALLFLGSGSVIHGMDNDQDMRHYGGLRKLMPITSATFIVGWLAIAGVPPFSGFWSKDEILAFAWEENVLLWLIGLITAVITAFYMSRQVFMTFYGRYRFADVRPEEISAAWSVRMANASAAVDEAQAQLASAEEAIAKANEKHESARAKLDSRNAEMSEADTADERAVAKATKNLERASGAVETAEAAVAAAVEAHAEAQRAVLAAQTQQEQVVGAAAAVGDGTDGSIFNEPDTGDLDEADFGAEVKARREYHPHESPWLMTLPLVVLAAGAVVAGVMNLPFSKDLHFLGNWLEPSLYHNEAHLSSGAGAKWALAIVAVIGGAVGIAAAVAVYLQRAAVSGRSRSPQSGSAVAGRDGSPRAEGAKPKYWASRVELPLFARGWFVDESITNFMGGPGRKSFDAVVCFDTTVVDGTVNRVGRWVRLGGNAVRRVQSGFVRSYALMVAIGAVALFAWFLSRASW